MTISPFAIPLTLNPVGVVILKVVLVEVQDIAWGQL